MRGKNSVAATSFFALTYGITEDMALDLYVAQNYREVFKYQFNEVERGIERVQRN
jgi:hypothetical protein